MAKFENEMEDEAVLGDHNLIPSYKAEIALLRDALEQIYEGKGMVIDRSTVFMSGVTPYVMKELTKRDMQEVARKALDASIVGIC